MTTVTKNDACQCTGCTCQPCLCSKHAHDCACQSGCGCQGECQSDCQCGCQGK